MGLFKQKVVSWLRAEIEDEMDAYDLTEQQAKENIKSLLVEDEYRDELTDSQVRQAILLLE